MSIRLRDVEVGDLNNVCIMILSKFARELHDHDGTVLKLQSPTVLLEVARYAESIDNPRLRILFQRLKLELRSQINSAVPNRAEVGSLIMHRDLKSQIHKRIEERRLQKS